MDENGKAQETKETEKTEEAEKRQRAIALLLQLDELVKFGEVTLTLSKHNDKVREIKATFTSQTRF